MLLQELVRRLFIIQEAITVYETLITRLNNPEQLSLLSFFSSVSQQQDVALFIPSCPMHSVDNVEMLRFGQCYSWSEHTNVLFQKCWLLLRHKHHRKMSSNTEEGKNNKKSGEGWGRGGQWKPEWSTVWYSEGRVVRCRCREHKVSVVKHHWAWRWVIILNLWILLLRIGRDDRDEKFARALSLRLWMMTHWCTSCWRNRHPAAVSVESLPSVKRDRL